MRMMEGGEVPWGCSGPSKIAIVRGIAKMRYEGALLGHERIKLKEIPVYSENCNGEFSYPAKR
jgi:hypothetical protein